MVPRERLRYLVLLIPLIGPRSACASTLGDRGSPEIRFLAKYDDEIVNRCRRKRRDLRIKFDDKRLVSVQACRLSASR
jgi:hypothetical protein